MLGSNGKKERNHLQSAGVHLGKRKKEDSGRLKDRSGKKKARNSNKEDGGKRGSTPVGNAHALEYQEGDIKAAKSQDFRNENQKEAIALEPNSNCQLAESNDDYAMKSASSVKASADPLSGETFGHDFALGTHVKAEDSEQHDPASTRISPKGGSPADGNHAGRVPIEAEDGKTTPNCFNDVKDESQNLGNLSGASSSIAVDSEAKPFKARCTL